LRRKNIEKILEERKSGRKTHYVWDSSQIEGYLSRHPRVERHQILVLGAGRFKWNGDLGGNENHRLHSRNFS
jgi:hypothetical protein